MNHKKYTIAITGSIGAGKSTLLKILSEKYPVFDADKAGHEALLQSIDDLKILFPSCINNHEIDRKCIANIIFNQPTKKQELENLTHPKIRKKMQDFIMENDFCFLEIPLLFEKNLQAKFDQIWLVSTDFAIRKKRVMQRGLLESDFLAREQYFVEEEIKKQQANFIFDGNADLIPQIKKAFSEIQYKNF